MSVGRHTHKQFWILHFATPIYCLSVTVVIPNLMYLTNIFTLVSQIPLLYQYCQFHLPSPDHNQGKRFIIKFESIKKKQSGMICSLPSL